MCYTNHSRIRKNDRNYSNKNEGEGVFVYHFLQAIFSEASLQYRETRIRLRPEEGPPPTRSSATQNLSEVVVQRK